MSDGKRIITIPRHDPVNALTMGGIVRDAGLTEEGVRDFLKKRLAHFKVPRYVRFVEEFPLTVTGKVQKYRIREVAARELALAEATPPAAKAGAVRESGPR